MAEREWKPGDVATMSGVVVMVVEENCEVPGHTYALGPHWHYAQKTADGCTWASELMDRDARPLVVIDPEDREQVERFTHLFLSHHWGPDHQTHTDAGQAALREFASPTPPRPDEPMGLGAVVEDASGLKWVRVEELPPFGPWYCGVLPEDDCSIADGAFREWAQISAVRVLSEGVQP